MNKNKKISIAKDVINLEIKALQKLKKSISGSFNEVSASVSTRLDTLANDVIALSIALG